MRNLLTVLLVVGITMIPYILDVLCSEKQEQVEEEFVPDMR